MFQHVVVVQGSKIDVNQLPMASGVDSKEIRKIPQAKMKDVLQLHRKHFANYMIIHQPYELTDENIEYIANYIKPVGFISMSGTPTAEEEMPIQGRSFHIKFQSKRGQVMDMYYKGGNSQEDFENHLQAHLKYNIGNMLSESDKVVHMTINFPNEMSFGKAFEVLFRNCLRPDVSEEGFHVVQKTRNINSSTSESGYHNMKM